MVMWSINNFPCGNLLLHTIKKYRRKKDHLSKKKKDRRKKKMSAREITNIVKHIDFSVYIL